MTIYYLMIKTHKKTGLKYLCQTTQDPFKYKGSGTEWKKHLKKHGTEHHTEILHECGDKKELRLLGEYYSILFSVVTSSDDFGNKIWANAIPETGGGDGSKNKGRTPWNKGLKGVYTQTEESNEARRKARLGKSSPMKGRTGELNPMFGKSVTDFMTEEEILSWKKSLSNRTPWNKGKKISELK